MTPTALIICGALAREVIAINQKYGWGADVFGVPASVHSHPQKIAPLVEKRILELRERYARLIVIFGDCGSSGKLDAVLERYDVERIAGPHCYEMYGGKTFEALMEEEPGTYFLTDFLAQGFEGTVIKSMGLDKRPVLKEIYFRNYKRLVYMSQREDETLKARAQKIADYLDLPLEFRHTGYGLLEERLAALMNAAVPQLP